jgi:hypothetical protein
VKFLRLQRLGSNLAFLLVALRTRAFVKFGDSDSNNDQVVVPEQQIQGRKRQGSEDRQELSDQKGISEARLRTDDW